MRRDLIGLFILAGLTLSFLALAAPGQTSRGVGSGLAFSPPSYATLLNPGAVVSAPTAALAGSYRPENENPFASFVGSTGNVGIGASYRKEGTKPKDGKKDLRKDILEAALGARVLFVTLGGTLRKTQDEKSNYDVSVAMDLGPLRIGTVLRNMKEGSDRVDSFVGLKAGSFHIEIDAKKPKPFEEDYWLVDTGVAFVTSTFSISAGYDGAYTQDKIEEGEVHGGLSFRLMEGFFVDGMYRPFSQEWSSADWLVGARVIF